MPELLDPDMREVERAIEQEIGRLAAAPRQAPAPIAFVEFGERSCAAMIQAARDVVAQAQQQLDETQKQADLIMTAIQEREATIADLNERHRALGEAILTAARECINGNGKTRGSE